MSDRYRCNALSSLCTDETVPLFGALLQTKVNRKEHAASDGMAKQLGRFGVPAAHSVNGS